LWQEGDWVFTLAAAAYCRRLRRELATITQTETDTIRWVVVSRAGVGLASSLVGVAEDTRFELVRA
jgi:hypothetical protein